MCIYTNLCVYIRIVLVHTAVKSDYLAIRLINQIILPYPEMVNCQQNTSAMEPRDESLQRAARIISSVGLIPGNFDCDAILAEFPGGAAEYIMGFASNILGSGNNPQVWTEIGFTHVACAELTQLHSYLCDRLPTIQRDMVAHLFLIERVSSAMEVDEL